MTDRAARARAIERVAEVVGRDHDDERALRIALLGEIRRHVPFDVFVWLLTDPETEVGSAPLADAPVPADLPRLIGAKYRTPVNRWTALATTTATLVESTGGDLGQSALWDEVLSTYGVTDVASTVFRDGHGCWGWLDLWRTGGTFTPEESAHLAAVAAPITDGLRRAQARTFATTGARPEARGPVVLVLAPDLSVRGQTTATDAQLRALLPTAGDRPPVPAVAFNVAAQLRAVEEGVDDHQPAARVHLGGGTWATARAARVGGADGDIAVTLEAASAAERRSLFTRSHALTPRETELVELLARGADTRTAARELVVSEHTVQDHLKAIAARTGVRGRRALLARITGA